MNRRDLITGAVATVAAGAAVATFARPRRVIGDGETLNPIMAQTAGCLRCADRWRDGTEHHVTDFVDGRGCFPLCEPCWKSLVTPEKRWPYYVMMLGEWLAQMPESEATWFETTFPAIKRAVMEGR